MESTKAYTIGAVAGALLSLGGLAIPGYYSITGKRPMKESHAIAALCVVIPGAYFAGHFERKRKESLSKISGLEAQV